MKKIEKSILGISIFLIFLLGGCSKPIAIINGEKITQKEFHKELEKRFGKQMIEDIILEKLIFQSAKKENIKVSPKEIEEKINEMKNNPQFEMLLKMQNLTLKDIENRITLMFTLRKLISKSISQQEKEAFFNAHKDQLEEVKASHILVKTLKEAVDILNKLNKGENFASLAKRYSIDPGSKNSNGELGYFNRSRMDPKFSEAAFKLEVSQISSPIKTSFGYHIIKCEGKKKTSEELKDKIEDAAITQEQTKNYIEKLRKNAQIKTNL
ncbi:MAG: peptidylprolyl isomerase [Armatimonadetes bacterium]|nr:peptidylprolyl isomerase [Armatimonadota bacterium]